MAWYTTSLVKFQARRLSAIELELAKAVATIEARDTEVQALKAEIASVVADDEVELGKQQAEFDAKLAADAARFDEVEAINATLGVDHAAHVKLVRDLALEKKAEEDLLKHDHALANIVKKYEHTIEALQKELAGFYKPRANRRDKPSKPRGAFS